MADISDKKAVAGSIGADFSCRVFRYALTDSTNKRAKLFAEGESDAVTLGESFCSTESYLFIAESQSLGRGRRGRSFLSEAGGLYMSYLFTPDIHPDETAKITAYAALATAEAIGELTGAEVKIKWVNDLFLGGRKIAGILAEGAVREDGSGFRYSIIGIGVNLAKIKFEGELEAIATDLETEIGIRLSPEELGLEICRRLALIKGGLPLDFMKKYKNRSNLIGRAVTVSEGGSVFEATALDICDDGRLRVKTEEGEERLLSCADVSLKIKA